MVNFIPQRYSEPKWQAVVTPDDKAFSFDNGVRVRSMWELKQALATLPEDEIRKYINSKDNFIADWIQNVVGDVELAQEMRKYDHRWGLIVALERHMMRTLNLPSHVAKRWLEPAKYDFTFVSGQKVYSLADLIKALNEISDETFHFHLERVPNDIARWVYEVIGDYTLADILEDASTKEQMRRFIEDHIEMLKDASES